MKCLLRRSVEQTEQIEASQRPAMFSRFGTSPADSVLPVSVERGLPFCQKTLDLTCKDEFEFDHWVTGRP